MWGPYRASNIPRSSGLQPEHLAQLRGSPQAKSNPPQRKTKPTLHQQALSHKVNANFLASKTKDASHKGYEDAACKICRRDELSLANAEMHKCFHDIRSSIPGNDLSDHSEKQAGTWKHAASAQKAMGGSAQLHSDALRRDLQLVDALPVMP